MRLFQLYSATFICSLWTVFSKCFTTATTRFFSRAIISLLIRAHCSRIQARSDPTVLQFALKNHCLAFLAPSSPNSICTSRRVSPGLQHFPAFINIHNDRQRLLVDSWFLFFELDLPVNLLATELIRFITRFSRKRKLRVHFSVTLRHVISWLTSDDIKTRFSSCIFAM